VAKKIGAAVTAEGRNIIGGISGVVSEIRSSFVPFLSNELGLKMFLGNQETRAFSKAS